MPQWVHRTKINHYRQVRMIPYWLEWKKRKNEAPTRGGEPTVSLPMNLVTENRMMKASLPEKILPVIRKLAETVRFNSIFSIYYSFACKLWINYDTGSHSNSFFQMFVSLDKDRPKPLAPTCNVCLIRDDLTTIWCEVTSSIRTRSLKEEDESNPFSDTISSAVMTTTTSLESSEEKGTESVPSQPSGADEIKELLLCLRPIRDGEEKVDESLRFATVPTSSTSLPIEHDVVVSENNAMTGNTPAPSSELTPNTSSGSGNSAFNTNDSAGSTHSVNSPVAKMTEQMKMRPPKKRRIREQPQAVVVPLMTGSSDKTMSPPKICSPESNAKKENLLSTTAREQSVVESLMLMSHNC